MQLAGRLFDFVSGRERLLAHGIILVTMAAIVAVAAMDGDRVKSLDEPDFVGIAQHLVFEGDFRNPDTGEITAYRAPGLVFFIAPFVRMGAGLMELRMLNALLVGGALFLLFHMLARERGPLAGLFAVALVPFWPVILYAATTLYPQTLAAFLLVLTVFLLDRFFVLQRYGTMVLAGLSFGALVLTVPIFLLLSPIFALWIIIYFRPWFRPLIVFAVVSATLTGSWTLRNYIAFDAFVPVASSSGYNLLAGNTPNARFNTSLDVAFEPQVYTDMTGKTEIEQNKVLTDAALQLMRDDPERIAWLYLGKFAHWFDYSNRLMSDEAVEGGASAINVSTREVVLLLCYMLIVLPLLAHVAMVRRFPFTRLEVLFVALWIGGGLAYALFFTRVRFRIPFDWLIIASNAIFLAALVENAVKRHRERGNAMAE